MIAPDEMESPDARTAGGRQPPPTEEDTPAGGRYIARSGLSWTVEELTALARHCLIEEPED